MVVFEEYTFDDYKRAMDRQININDIRERVFQDNVIRPFLKSLFVEYDIEPVDIKIKTDVHDYLQYCGTYEKNGVYQALTPDLCISSGWNWDNKRNKVDYKCVVEIKSPILDNITGVEPGKYRCLDEIKKHLMAQRNNKVILTDGVTWVFYDKASGHNPKKPPICLGNLVYKCKQGRSKPIVERTKAGKPVIEKIDWEKDEKVFNDLKENITIFVRKN